MFGTTSAMGLRGTEAPMEGVEYRDGPHVDQDSPWIIHPSITQRPSHPKKRGYEDFQSPQKPDFPSFGAPNNQPFFFSSQLPQPPPQPPAQFRQSSFTTPRKPTYEIDESSGPEYSSPADKADNEDTPEIQKTITFTANDAPQIEKTNSLFSHYGKFAPPASPGRGEIAKRPINEGVMRRIQKKRKREKLGKQLAMARRPSQDSDEEYTKPIDAQPTHMPVKVSWISSFFAFIHAYPDAPSILTKYLQVFFNAAILLWILYMVFTVWSAIKGDVDKASDDAMAEVLSEMAACSKNYIDNRCGPDLRLPALETVCSNWELCMNRDPTAVKRARVSATAFAEIINSFVEPITFKTMAFSCTLVTLALLINNVTFAMFRRSQDHHADLSRHPSASYMQPGPTQFPRAPGPQYEQRQWGLPNDSAYAGQPMLDYPTSPSKEHRARSRSPQKALY